MKKLNCKGFGVIEGLLLLIVVGIIGVAGFYVYKTTSKIDSGDDGTTIVKRDTTDKEDQKSEAENDENYLLIEEWGVKVPLMPEDNEISYKISENDKNSAVFVSSEQKALGGHCGEFSSARYSIYRAKSGQKPSNIALNNRLDNAAKEGLNIEIDEDVYYILGDFSGGDCTGKAKEGNSISDEEVKANNNLLDSLKSLVKA